MRLTTEQAAKEAIASAIFDANATFQTMNQERAADMARAIAERVCLRLRVHGFQLYRPAERTVNPADRPAPAGQLVERLRAVRDWWRAPGLLAEEAADEIERLTKNQTAFYPSGDSKR